MDSKPMMPGPFTSDSEALAFAVDVIRKQTPIFAETLAQTTALGTPDAVGLFLEHGGDERGQLTAFLEDFTGPPPAETPAEAPAE